MGRDDDRDPRETAGQDRARFAMTLGATKALLLHSWPQNVRELRMLVRRAAEDVPETDAVKRLTAEYLAAVLGRRVQPAAPEQTVSAVIRTRQPRPALATLASAFDAARGNVSRSAALLGRRREVVHRWIKEYGLTALDSPPDRDAVGGGRCG
jgi:transcriptional regulator of acetoin/glycerol metabolism